MGGAFKKTKMKLQPATSPVTTPDADADVTHHHTDYMRRRHLRQTEPMRAASASGRQASGSGSGTGTLESNPQDVEEGSTTGTGSDSDQYGPYAPNKDGQADVLPTDAARWHFNMSPGSTKVKEATSLYLLSDTRMEDPAGQRLPLPGVRRAWTDAQTLLQHHLGARAVRDASQAQHRGNKRSLFAAVKAHSTTWASWNLMCVPAGDLMDLTGRPAPLGARPSELKMEGYGAGGLLRGGDPEGARSEHPRARVTSSVMEVLQPGLTCYRQHMAEERDANTGEVPHQASCVRLVVKVCGVWCVVVSCGCHPRLWAPESNLTRLCCCRCGTR